MASNGSESIDDVHKKLGFSFIQLLMRMKSSRCEEIAQMVAEEFNIDASGQGGLYDANIDLLEIFTAALNEKEKTDESDQETQFKAFLGVLERKGYFSNTTPGSTEYEARVEKARGKFKERSNPYDGMTAEEVKAKGNEFMKQCKYKNAIQCYTKAIEMDPENYVFFANRSAAYTHVKEYKNAILDSERSIALNPGFAKSYSRLGTALFYEANYVRAVEAFTKACELDPSNSVYQEELKRAEDKKNATAAPPAAANPFGMPGMGGMPDFSQIQALASNPQFMQMAQNMMQNPEMARMMSQMSAGELSNEELMAGVGTPGEDGTVRTPFGSVPQGALEDLQRQAMNNPKFAAIQADIRANGMGAMQKYLTDPDVLAMMGSMGNLFGGNGGSTA